MTIPFQSANCAPVYKKDIPVFEFEQFCGIPFDQFRLCAFFGVPEGEYVKLYTILSEEKTDKISIVSTKLKKNTEYSSFTVKFPQFHLFERELYENFKLKPVGHPWLKPLRKISDYPFFKCNGSETHEVAVGPVHAGVIEPGHFRFNCAGENILSLEIMHGYQSRGVEKLFLKGDIFSKRSLAESVCGDSAIAGVSAYVGVMEALGNVQVDKKVQAQRALMLELERAAVHIGDLGAISGDIAYISGADFYGAVRTVVINTSQSIGGNRFGRGFVGIGSNRFPIEKHIAETAVKNLLRVKEDIEVISSAFFSDPIVLSRLEDTCVVNIEEMMRLNAVGMAARSCGIKRDVRTDNPWGYYKENRMKTFVLEKGDIFSRAYLRYLETVESLETAINILSGNDFSESGEEKHFPLQPDSICVSLVEAWRGELAHILLTDSKGDSEYYKIKDPSFNNWNALELAVRENGISDFPVCNKSFNLSYCGFDL
ncbi:MAG: NADH-quinone oxidoreductase subunit C [Spirochaetes bacterium]|nr:NADH-quinone oxidoreductase subunit C [Spirochaetota bacterium]